MKRLFHFRASSGQLGPLEQRLLEALWARGTGTVRELLESGYEDLAYTTVMTTLDRLFKKNVLTRTAEGRAFRYAPRFTREELHREVAGEAFRQLLDASPAASLPLSYLVEILTERDAQLLDELRQLVETKRRELRNHDQRNGEPRNKEKA
jgi:predicted transcriptional regulator